MVISRVITTFVMDVGPPPLVVPIISISCSFWGKNWLKNSFSHLPSNLASPPRGNDGSATVTSLLFRAQQANNEKSQFIPKIS